MKKLLLLITLLLCPIIVYAQNNDYTITDYYISSEVEIAGAIKIKELIVVDGPFNNFQRDIIWKDSSLEDWEAKKVNFEESSIYNAGGIDNLQVAVFPVEKNVNFDTMDNIEDFATLEDNIDEGQKNKYTIKNTDNGQNVNMYYPAKDQKIAFYLEYVITNAVVIHEDVAELYYPYVNKAFNYDINNFNLRVFIPVADATSSFNIWAHGPQNGTVNKYTNEDQENIGLIATSKKIEKNTGFDIRLTFDKSSIMIPQFLKHSEQNALSKIKKIEKQRAIDTNQRNKTMSLMQTIILVMSIIYIIFLIILWIFIYLKYSNKHKCKDKYYSDFIEDYNVEVIDYLYNQTITSKAFKASLLNLAYKKNIEITKISANEYQFNLNNKSNLTDSEKYLVNFLFNKVGDEKEFTTKQLNLYVKDSKSSLTFYEFYINWKSKVKQEATNQGFFSNNKTIKICGILYVLIGVILFIINSIIIKSNNIISLVVILLSVLFIIYILFGINKLSLKGYEDYCKWNLFQQFLKKFQNIDKNKLPDTNLWGRYMVYAVIFNEEDTLQKIMQEKRPDLNNFLVNNIPQISKIISDILNNNLTIINKKDNENS